MKNPNEITYNGKLLSDILADHVKWRNGDENGIRANLRGADLRGADLRGANLGRANLVDADLRGANLGRADLRGAYMRGATGNMREIKSMQIETWPVTYTFDTLQIGCQRHPIAIWRKADPRWIAAMDDAATDWWGKFGALVLAMIDASPAIATGKETA